MKVEFIRDITSLGGLPVYAALLAASLLVFNSQRFFYQLIIGLILAYLITTGIRTFYFKKRPKAVKYKSGNWFSKIDASSFPSLHTMRATILAALISNFFVDITIAILAAMATAAVAWSRIALKRHDWKDVLGGVIFGILISAVIIFLFQPYLL